MYPIAIVLILMNIFYDYISKTAYTGAIIGTSFVSLYDGLSAANVSINFWVKIPNAMPLYNSSFGWLIPSILGGIIGAITSFSIKHK